MYCPVTEDAAFMLTTRSARVALIGVQKKARWTEKFEADDDPTIENASHVTPLFQ